MTDAFTGNQYRKPDDLAAWSALQTERAIEPDLPIIDAHHHIWNSERGRYLVSDVARDCGRGHDIRASVFIECMSAHRTDGPEAFRPVGETESVATSTSAYAGPGATGPRIAAAIVGFADLCLGDRVGAVLDAHLAAGEGRFRGIRHAACHDPVIGPYAYRNAPPGLMADPRYRAGVAEMEKRGLVFDAWVFHRQIPEVLALARAFPGLTIVLNHLGGLLRIGGYRDRAGDEFEAWRLSLRDLARARNVVVKVGGLGMLTFGFDFHRRTSPPVSSELAEAWGPLIDTAIEIFGPDRCMFESNFSVDNQSCTYVSLWNAFKLRTRDYQLAERTALFSGTAARTYRIEMP